ncbi:MAG: zinc ribbon domain-containing protein [Chloroflexota bacterium]
MPIYEFGCRTCGKRSSFFTRSVSQPLTPTCSSCGGSDLVRLIGSFAYHKSMQTIHEESGEPTMFSGPDYYKDPRNIGRWAEKRFKEMGEEMPDHLKNMIQSAREGEMPESMKDLKSASPDASYH